ncbi:hypothetical protein ACFVSU_10660 [Microbacterium sp. NPDC058062]|uniref:hypothetical protein n=1 Tax=Microbacterium sp. NPDC058062 TaxID=3346320 RepID=UPI0036D83409
MRRRRLTWLIGGIGLIACGVIGVLRGAVLGTPVLSTTVAVVEDLLWAGAILVLAIGLGREGSVVARKPLGLAASAVVAVWPLTASLVGMIAGPIDAEQVDTWSIWGDLVVVAPVVAGLIATVQVARARVVPKPWNWAPLWVLLTQVVLWVVPQLVGVAAPGAFLQMASALSAFGTLGFLAGTIGLGVVAVVLANRSSEGTVEVFRSATPE